MLQAFLDSCSVEFRERLSVNTFGFAYWLDSVLLKAIAVEGGGGYSFIPDSYAFFLCIALFEQACSEWGGK